MGGTDVGPVRIEGDFVYIMQMSAILAQIRRWHAGRAVIEKIRAHGRLAIKPWPPDLERSLGKFNAAHDPNRARLVPKDRSFGYEIEAEVLFSPQTFAAVLLVNGVPRPNKLALRPGALGEDVLIHEMVHAGRWLGGDADTTKFKGKLANFDNREEFVAILVANIFMSEKGYPVSSLRYDHHGFKPLPARINTSETFLYADENYPIVEELCSRQPNICALLRQSPAPFNPIRAFLDQGNINLPAFEEASVPLRISQSDDRPALTDDYLIGLLKPRFRANDVLGYGARARSLESAFNSMNAAEAKPLLSRLGARQHGDLVAGYFRYHLSTTTRNKLLEILKSRASRP